MNRQTAAEMTTAPNRNLYIRLSQLTLLLLAALVGWLIYDRVIRPGGMMAWDQAGHALRGLVLAQEIQGRDWTALLYDIYRQVYWPPAHTVVLAGAFAGFGSTILVARSVSLVLFLLGAGVIYGCGMSLDRGRGPFVAFVATALYLTAPALTPYAGQVMQEIPALASFYLAIWLFLRMDDATPPRDYIWLGLVIVLTYLTKLNYGVLLMLVIGFELLLEARFRPRALFNRRILYLVLAVLMPLAIWFAYPPKLMRTWDALINQPFGTTAVFSVEGLLFYPRALVEICGSPALFALFMGGLAYALWRAPRDRGLRVLVLIFVIQFTIGQLHQTKVDRHLLPLLPALFLATGSLLANLAWGERMGFSRPRLVNVVLATMLVLLSSRHFVTELRPASTLARPYVADEIAALVDDAAPTLILSTINLARPAPPQLDWVLATDYGLMSVALSDVAMNLEQDLSVAELAQGLPGPEFLGAAVRDAALRSRAPGPVRTLYVGLSDYTGYSQSPAALQRFLEEMQADGLFDRVLVVTPIDPARAFVPIGQPPYAVEFLTEPLEALGLSRQSEQRFDDANVAVIMYE